MATPPLPKKTNPLSDLELGTYSTAIESNGVPLSDYYPPLDCKGAECDAIKCALHPFATHSVWKAQGQEHTKPWRIAGKVEIDLFLGSGQLVNPFTTSHGAFALRCKTAGFSADFLRNLRAKQPLYECKIHQNNDQKPMVLELAIAVYETDAIFILVRYDIIQQVLKGMIFFKRSDSISTCDLTFDSIIPFLDERRDEIKADPLMLLPTLFSFLQFRSHNPVRWRTSLQKAEAHLNVTRRRAFLDANSYPAASNDFAFLNAHLTSLAEEIHDTATAAKTIRLLLEQMEKVVRICKEVERCPSSTELMIKCNAVNAQLFLLQLEMSTAYMQTLQGALYNKIVATDNQTMKSIAVIGLVFLPTMLMSGVFSTGIFSLLDSSSGSGASRVASKFWKLFLPLCVGLTVLTLGLWIAWERHGNRWLEKSGDMDAQSRTQRDLLGLHIPNEIQLRNTQISQSEEILAHLKRARRQRSLCSDGYYCMEHYKDF